MANYNYPEYNSFSGCDMVATFVVPKNSSGTKTVNYCVGELQTLSYSIHMDRSPVRSIGNINAIDYVTGPRTIAGSLVFAVFDKHFAHSIMQEIRNGVDESRAFLIDEIPPFNIVVSLANEYGTKSKMVIYGVRLVNEGQVMSINDIYTENTYQYVATDLEYLSGEDDNTSNESSNSNTVTVNGANNANKYSNTDKSVSVTTNNNSTTTIELKYDVVQSASSAGNGVVNFWTRPFQKDGSISVQNSEGKTYLVDVASNTTVYNKCSFSAPAGAYTVYWKNGKLKSSVASLVIPLSKTKEEKELVAPVIEEIGEDYISIYSNVGSHSRVVYSDPSGTKHYLKLNGRRITLKELSPGTKYSIQTADTELTTVSKKATATTHTVGQNTISDFSNYLNYNKSTLNNPDYKFYREVIGQATDETIASGANYISIVEVFNQLRLVYADKIKLLKESDFHSVSEYLEEVKRLTDLKSIAKELTTIAAKYTTNKLYGLNCTALNIQPPELQRLNGRGDCFELSNDMENITFYKQVNNSFALDKVINKDSFTVNEDCLTYTYSGKPNTINYVYATNSNGVRSSKTMFYACDDYEKVEEINKMRDITDYCNHLIKKEESNIVLYPMSQDNDRLVRDIAIEALLKPVHRSIDTPSILLVNDEEIVVSIGDNELLLKNGYRVVVSDIDEALMNTPKYKEQPAQTISFNVKKHGLRPGRVYAIWVENSEEIRVSDSITAKLIDSDDSLDEVYGTRQYFNNKIISELKMHFTEHGVNLELLSNVFTEKEDDVDINKTNLLYNILASILYKSPSISDMFSILTTFFKYSYPCAYSINSDFFNQGLITKNDLSKVFVQKDCIMSKINMSMENIEEYKSSKNKGDIIDLYDSNSTYSLIHFIETDMSCRSGFILTNNLSKSMITYDIAIRVED